MTERDKPDSYPRNGGDSGATTPAMSEGTSRRAFLGRVGRKAIYMTPVLLTLSASTAAAGSKTPSCQKTGSPCTLNEDCCGTMTCNFGFCG